MDMRKLARLTKEAVKLFYDKLEKQQMSTGNIVFFNSAHNGFAGLTSNTAPKQSVVTSPVERKTTGVAL